MATSYDWQTFGVSVATHLVICVLCLIIFDLLRCKESLRRFYAPRYYVRNKGYRRPKPLPPSASFFGWVRCLASYTEDEILAVAGYDGLVYLRIFRFGVQLFFVLSLVVCAFILPINWTDDLVDENQRNRAEADENDEDKDKEVESTDYDKVTMANIQEGSNRLWAHLVATWFVGIFTLWLLWKYHKAAVDLRIEYLSSTRKGGRSHSIFVTDIPGIRFGHPLDRLMNSIIFKFLPKSVKDRVIASVSSMTNIASSSVGMIGDLGKSAIDHGKAAASDVASRIALLDNNDDDAIDTFVRPVAKEITDMTPDKWMHDRLSEGYSYERAVEIMFREVFPEGEICCANMVMDTSALESLVAKLDKAVQSLEDILDQYATWIQNSQEIKPFVTRIIPITEGKWAIEKYGHRPVKVDQMEFLVLKIQNLKPLIIEMEGKAKSEVTASAFVLFNTRWSQVVGASGFFHHFESTWNAQSAPNPCEIVWENVKWRTWERGLRIMIVWFLFFLLCLFFMIPVGIVQGMIEVNRLESYTVIGSIVKFPLVKGLVESVIPNLALELFLIILPMLLHAMNHYQGIISRSAIDAEVIRKYFIFLVITVFLASFVARSFADQLSLLRDNPEKIVDALGSSAPKASTFFLYFIMTSVFITGASQMIQIPGLVITWILTVFSGTQRAKDRIWQHKPMSFGHVVSRHTLVLLFGLVFSVVNPLILPVSLCYFLLMNLFNRYSLLYILSEDYESGGEIWTHIYEHVIVALFFQQLMMAGIMGLKKFPYATLVTPLPIITIVFKIFVDRMFKRPLTLLSLRAARDLDKLDQAKEKKEQFHDKQLEEEVLDGYKNSCFKVDWDKISALCSDVPKIQAALEKPHNEGAAMVANLNVSAAAEYYPVASYALSSTDVETDLVKNQGTTSGEKLLNN